MFLKTQEDLDKLLEDYPSKDYEIEIRKGASDDDRISVNDGNAIWLHVGKFEISPDDVGIVLKQSIEDGLQKGGLYRYDYTYGIEGIEVLNLWKKLSHTEDSELEKYPLILNGVDLGNKEEKVRELWKEGEKLAFSLTYAKLLLDISMGIRLNGIKGGAYAGAKHFTDSATGLQLATIARKIGEKNNPKLKPPQYNLSVRTFSEKIKELHVFPGDSTVESIDEIYENNDSPFKKEINKWALHMDYDVAKERIAIKRNQETGFTYEIKGINVALLKGETDKLFTISENLFRKLHIPIGKLWHPENALKLLLTTK